MCCNLTTKEQPLSCIQEALLLIRARNGVESAHANYALDRIARAIVCIGVCAQYTAKVCLKPVFLGGLHFASALVHTVALDSSRNLDLHTHVDPRECIVAAVASQRLVAYALFRAFGRLPVDARSDLV